MRRMLKWLGTAVVAVAAIVVLSWLAGRASGPGRMQREALALMQAPWAAPGSNAFDALWLLPYPVDDADMAGIVERDAARLRAAPPPGGDGWTGASAFRSEAATHHPVQLPDRDDRARLCTAYGEDCLIRVRADLPAYQALLERHAGLFQRVAALERHGHVANRFPARMDMPFPPLDLARAGTTHAAVLFAQGDLDAGLAVACRDLATWRRLAANSDMLVVAMMGVSASDAGGRLIAGMLSELPADHAVPGACRAALRPPQPEELTLCQAMRGEFAYATGARASLAQRPHPLLYNETKSRGMAALRLADACMPQARDRIAADQPFPAPPAPRPTPLACVDNLVGCILDSIAAPAYAQYSTRALDHGARLRLLAALLWLRDTASDRRPLAARLAELPQPLRSPARPLQPGSDGASLRVRQYDAPAADDDWFELPLPGARAGVPEDGPEGQRSRLRRT